MSSMSLTFSWLQCIYLLYVINVIYFFTRNIRFLTCIASISTFSASFCLIKASLFNCVSCSLNFLNKSDTFRKDAENFQLKLFLCQSLWKIVSSKQPLCYSHPKTKVSRNLILSSLNYFGYKKIKRKKNGFTFDQKYSIKDTKSPIFMGGRLIRQYFSDKIISD
ncbi:hypothetical protein BpHYR1_053482 [Brachionus plicatilis]|uniref:Uncharacterized protein n=1 Tax=Brachionus plicatilis TaxID=10195 RepID=A0A3M7R3A5_BRAPC|nr:hypothetical protein BpHYR1_053482 [Brachionus plicatilis]